MAANGRYFNKTHKKLSTTSVQRTLRADFNLMGILDKSEKSTELTYIAAVP